MRPLYSAQMGEWAEPLMVTVNGTAYPTQLYNGVQRFVPDPKVEAKFARGAVDLNRLALLTIEGRHPLEKYIALLLNSGYSVAGFDSSVSQLIENNPSFFPGPLEDYFTLSNPLWAMEEAELEEALAPKFLDEAGTRQVVEAIVERHRSQGHLNLSAVMAEVKEMPRTVDAKIAVEIARELISQYA